MTERPGSRLAARPLHFILLADCSESMSLSGKVTALNQAIRDAMPALRDAAAQNPHVEVLVRAIAFSTGAAWAIERPTPVAEARWEDLGARGYTDLGAALRLATTVLATPPMEPRSLPPALVLVSDGQPTDDWRPALDELLATPWGGRALRLAIAIGKDADLEVLQAFVANPEIRPFRADNAPELIELLRWASTVAARVASSPRPFGEHAAAGDLTPPRVAVRPGIDAVATW